jgi:hypothetical protein
MIIINNIEQGSIEWGKLRIGKVTGTRLKDLRAKDNLPLIDKLIAEIVSEQSKEIKCTEDMQRGTNLEPLARKDYEEYTGHKVEQFGFLQSEKFSWFGLSPDGLISNGEKYYKGVEIKCPDTHTHVKYIRQNTIPAEYKDQILSYFLVNEDHQEHDFVSYDNRFLIKPLHIVTVRREELEKELQEAEEDMIKFYEKFTKYYNQITF